MYVTPEIKRLLAEQLARVDALQRTTGRIVPYLFPHLTGRHRGRRVGGFGKTWATACKKAGVLGRLLHDLRRTAVRNMERQGVPRSVATKLTGHKTESVYPPVRDCERRRPAGGRPPADGRVFGRVGRLSRKSRHGSHYNIRTRL